MCPERVGPAMATGGLLGRLVEGRLGHAVSRLLGGTPIWEREWDVCCVLDGCRLDLMREAAADRAWLPDPAAVGSLWSVGSQSAEWMDRTFGPAHRAETARTAYVTGNPFSAQPADHIVVTGDETLPLSGEQWGLLYEAWREEWVDGDISTIPPEPLTDAALAVWNRREALGVDRVLVHYMQPHAPFRSRPEWFLGTADTDAWGSVADEGDDADLADLTSEELAELRELAEAETDGIKDPWTRLRDGELPRGEFWAAYRDNLEWVLDDTARLLECTSARVAFTSDHGNAAGEWGLWSHPPGVPAPVLRRVPWVVRRGTGERSVDPDLPAPLQERLRAAGDGRDDEDAAALERRLADLGYR
jgi:hypothetical protein